MDLSRTDMVSGCRSPEIRLAIPLKAGAEMIGTSSWGGRAHRGMWVSMTGLPIDEWLYDHP